MRKRPVPLAPDQVKVILDYLSGVWELSVDSHRVLHRVALHTADGQEGVKRDVLLDEVPVRSRLEDAIALLSAKGLVADDGGTLSLTHDGTAFLGTCQRRLEGLEHKMREELRKELTRAFGSVSEDDIRWGYDRLVAVFERRCNAESRQSEPRQQVTGLTVDPVQLEEAILSLHQRLSEPVDLDGHLVNLAIAGQLSDLVSLQQTLPVAEAHVHNIIVDSNVLIALLCPADLSNALVRVLVASVGTDVETQRVQFWVLDETVAEIDRLLAYSGRQIAAAQQRWWPNGGQDVGSDVRAMGLRVFASDFLSGRTWGSYADYAAEIHRRIGDFARDPCQEATGVWIPPVGFLGARFVRLRLTEEAARQVLDLRNEFPYVKESRLDHDARVLAYMSEQQREAPAGVRWAIWTLDSMMPLYADALPGCDAAAILYKRRISQVHRTETSEASGATVAAGAYTHILQCLLMQEDRALPGLSPRSAWQFIHSSMSTGQVGDVQAFGLLVPALNWEDGFVKSIVDPTGLGEDSEGPFEEARRLLLDRRSDIVDHLLDSADVAAEYVSLTFDWSQAVAAHGTGGVRGLVSEEVDRWTANEVQSISRVDILMCPHSVTHIDLPWALVADAQRGDEQYAERDEAPDRSAQIPAPDRAVSQRHWDLLTSSRGCEAVFADFTDIYSTVKDYFEPLVTPGVPEALKAEATARDLLEIVDHLRITKDGIAHRASAAREGDLLVIHTGWPIHAHPTWTDLRGPRWEAAHVWNLHPWLDREAVNWVVEQHVGGVATDAPMLDCPLYLATRASQLRVRAAAEEFYLAMHGEGWEEIYQLHAALLGRGLLLLESLHIPESVSEHYPCGGGCFRSELVLTFQRTALQSDCALACVLMRRPGA